MSRFFIERPIFAWVLALVLMLAGALAITQLPVAQYPAIAPPQISISGSYPGASAQTVANTVIRPILQQMTGLDGLEYVGSSSESNGQFEIDLTFRQGIDPNIAQVQVQNKLSLAEPTLPSEVTTTGLRVLKATRDYMLIVGLISTDGSMNKADLGDYVASHMVDPLTRIPGVGDYTLFGSEYAMRIWLNPNALFKYGLTVGDVVTAIKAQNVQVPAGELGGLPAVEGQRLDATIIGPTELQSPEEFGKILLKTTANGARVEIKDVAKIELGPQSYSISARYNGQPSVGLGLKLAVGANQLSTEAAVKAEIKVLESQMPPGIKVVYPYDTAPYIVLSLREVLITLIEAIVLVFVVMFVFLQNFRATLVPTIAVPIVLLGTFGVLQAFGYSINTLTMLAMVLAVGLLVDDAIVVVENIDRLMHDERMPPKQAAIRSMKEISGALIGIALVLAAVYLPMAFFGGSAGVIYRQFSITIVSAMVLSVLTALIFTPSLCGSLLKLRPEGSGTHGFYGWFNRGFEKCRTFYLATVKKMEDHRRIAIMVYLAITAVMVLLFVRLPIGFLPNEDQGLILGQISLPTGSTAEQTTALIENVREYMLKNKSVSSVFTATGFSFAGEAQSQGFVVGLLKPWDERTEPSQSVSAVANGAMRHFFGNLVGKVFLFPPPPVLELGNATGFDLELENTGNLSTADFLAARNQFLLEASRDRQLMAVRPNGLGDAPQYKLDIDREQAEAYGISIADVSETIQGALASEYVDQFIRDGRVKDVFVQGEAEARMLPSDLSKWYVRNANNQMVPLNSFMTGHWDVGPQKVEIYNGHTAYEIQGEAAPGVSSGTAMAQVEKLVKKLPPGVSMEWTGLSYEEAKAGSQTAALYTISIIFVLLCLAALYESWSIPVAVILVVPLGIIGAVLANHIRGIDNDVYFQVGLLTTMGLAVKNAILIVEFALHFYNNGESLIDAALHAGRERLRPILMTSIAFICGTFPLAIASGAGAGAREAIGTAVVGGMITATVLAIFFVPLFFVSILTLTKVKPRPNKSSTEAAKQEG